MPAAREIVEDYSELTIEDLIPDEPLLVTLSHAGYAKAQPAADYKATESGRPRPCGHAP